MKKDNELSASAICKKLFYGTGEINYYMLAQAINNSDKIKTSSHEELTR